jgi:Cu/Zn superoxide dismutase
MTIASGSLVLATDYNAIRTTVDNVLGTGSGDSGYGQSLTSSSKTSSDVILDDDINELYADIQVAHTHQQGSATSLIAQVTTADLIEANNGVSFKGWIQYQTAANLISTNRLTANAASMTATAAKTTETKAAGWNGSNDQIVTVTFASAEARRFFLTQVEKLEYQHLWPQVATPNLWTGQPCVHLWAQ